MHTIFITSEVKITFLFLLIKLICYTTSLSNWGEWSQSSCYSGKLKPQLELTYKRNNPSKYRIAHLTKPPYYGSGFDIYYRRCRVSRCSGSKYKLVQCNVGISDAWSKWYPMISCSTVCGSGYKIEARTCKRVTAQDTKHRDIVCPNGEGVKTENCYFLCPVHGGWSSWGLGFCKNSCGHGYREVIRSCNSPTPHNGGDDCDGNDKEYEYCYEIINCPVSKPDTNFVEKWIFYILTGILIVLKVPLFLLIVYILRQVDWKSDPFFNVHPDLKVLVEYNGVIAANILAINTKSRKSKKTKTKKLKQDKVERLMKTDSQENELGNIYIANEPVPTNKPSDQRQPGTGKTTDIEDLEKLYLEILEEEKAFPSQTKNAKRKTITNNKSLAIKKLMSMRNTNIEQLREQDNAENVYRGQRDAKLWYKVTKMRKKPLFKVTR